VDCWPTFPRKNCWALAEHAGDRTPDGMRHLLARAVWDQDKVRDDVRDWLVAHLGDPEAVLVIDESGDLKQGTHTVGVQRHDHQRCRAAGVPDEVGFATKPELATVMLGRALAAGVPAGWVTGDEVYGASATLWGELAFYHCWTPARPRWPSWSGWPEAAGASRSAPRPARALLGWTSQARRWRSWYRWATLAMLGHAFLVVAALLQHIRHPPPSGLTRLTCNELQHLFAACWPGRSVIATTGCAGRCGDDDIKHAPEAATTNAAAWQP
jgi:hypothetical protein